MPAIRPAPKKEFLKIDFKGGTAKGELTCVSLQDHEFHIAYLPTLKLSAYGSSHDEAIGMLKEVVDEFFLDLVSLPEHKAHEELIKLGFVRSGIFKKQFKSEAYIDKEGILRNFNLSPETAIRESVVSV